MTALAGLRRRIQKLGPYQSLVLIFLPFLLVEPMKLVALVVAGKGHWLTGTGMIIGAYAVSLLLLERMFRVVKPKLLLIKWFATGWSWMIKLKARYFRRVRTAPE